MSPGMLLAPSFLLGGLARGARGRVLQVVGALAVARVARPGVWVEGDSVDVVYVVGYTALAASLAWAGSLVIQRRQRSASPSEPAALGADRGVVPVTGVHDGLVRQGEQP